MSTRPLTIRASKRRRIAAASVAVGAVLALAVPLPAHAARKGPAGSSYTPATYTEDTCTAGATCTHSASAERDGRQSVSSSVDRPEFAPPGSSERANAWAMATKTFKIPSSSSADVSITWRIDEASGSATNTAVEGAAVARVFLDEHIGGCSGCVVEDATRGGYGLTLVDAFAAPTGGYPSTASDAATAGLHTHTVVLRGPGGGRLPGGTYSVRGEMYGIAYVGCYLEDGTCAPELLGHSGSAFVSAVGAVVDINVVARP